MTLKNWTKSTPFTVISANAAMELMVPYFSPVIISLKGFLTSVTEEMRPLQTQSLGRSVFSWSTKMYGNHKYYYLNRLPVFACVIAFRHSVCASPNYWQRCLQSSGFRVCSTGSQPDRHH